MASARDATRDAIHAGDGAMAAMDGCTRLRASRYGG
jgi:hypothetical protein